MNQLRTFSAPDEHTLWQHVAADMAREPDFLHYAADLQLEGHTVQLEIDIDPGGGFESGSEFTRFVAPLPNRPTFYFTLHEQDWVHEIGKLLGLTDVEVGDPELDAAYIITTNDTPRLQALLAHPAVRQPLLQYPELRLELTPESSDDAAPVQLTFTKEQALVDPAQLQEIYGLLLMVLRQLAAPSTAE